MTYSDLNNAFDGDAPSQYLPSDDFTNNNISGGSGGSSSSSSSGGGNNQVVTVNGNDNGKYIPSILDKLVPGTAGDGGLTEDYQQMSNSNGWLQFMKNTFSFVPVSFWDNLNIYFLVSWYCWCSFCFKDYIVFVIIK